MTVYQNLVYPLIAKFDTSCQHNAVSKIIVVTPFVAIMKDQVEQLQSIGIRALAIGVDEEEDEEGAGKMDRLDCL